METVRRECCDYCMWLGPVNQDGTMRKHRPAREGTVSGERKVQDFTKPRCAGSNKPYARFGCEIEETATVNDQQPTTARTAADLPKGTRVTNPEGRMGTVDGCDIGRVTNTEHANYGREYIGVTWDPTESIPWGQRNRPFADELTIVAPADADEAPFQPGERVVHADGRRFTFVSVNPEDSSRILVERPTGGSVVSWRLSECRAENETEIATRHGETVKLHAATCKSQGDCASHNVKDRHAERNLELGSIPTCEPGITYGAWSEGAGGFVYSGVDCATDAANWAADELRTLAKDDDTDTIQILALCPDHNEQPKNGCEDCDTEDGE